MTAWRLLATTWVWDPTVVTGCAALLAAYAAAVRPLTARGLWFGAAVLVLLIALVSPLDTLGDRYLFSAHMLQHLLLLLVVPPFLLLGIPPRTAVLVLHWAPARRVEQVLNRPLLAWVLGIGVLWAWHLPVLYNAALANEGVHILQHLSFLVSATIFWWPVVAPVAERRLSPLVTVPYLLTAGMASSILGVILTFAPPGLYPPYAHPLGAADVLAIVRHDWGLSDAVDQQAGGLLMWVLGGPIYLVAGLGVLGRWWNEQEQEQEQEEDVTSDEWRVASG